MLSIDHSAYPHLIDLILSHADAHALNAFRTASHAALAQVEAIYARRTRLVVPHTGRDGCVVFPCRRSLRSLTGPEMTALAAGSSVPGMRRRYSAIRVLDLGNRLDLRTSRCALRVLLDGVHTIRIVGDLNAPLPFSPTTIIVAADLGRPEPFRGWLLSDSLVINYAAGTGGGLALAFFPPSGYYGPSALTLLFTRCLRVEMESMPHGARLGSRLMGDLARVVCDGHSVTLVDWGNVAALFPRGTRAEDVEVLRTWGGQEHKAARRRECLRSLARLAFEPGKGEEKIRCFSAEEYRRQIGEERYADYTVGLGGAEHFTK
ncbi:uncharacterized protein CcaverHIS019_0601160 [Cutaneotrichosporon cavernicola]|uniref:Uncharacterized protein n=1 Tax=Cutaneotrichosporon cavernicola TaxID=279322 RepID=A0AA48L807_9TREE|nr:uncharacterized protein CcaverHIS019_0601160 [Cutaneotrichosporon cavernicola]BEI93657.1 hypothetical protein CcaverHIS019_0601160 [Cutaneotrichosporon cavernicola]BEJ01434.1 hypothetical protein CcaverHIS631_0601160 [Cutaneotrichosporon cavernicola]BEJ09201.1 hypothetical protein CcaverHIS641_0601160 [Cutaneotrichosporon cavernicola]